MLQPQFEKNFDSWRLVARDLIANGTSPNQINWNQDVLSLFSFEAGENNLSASRQKNQKSNLMIAVPPEFIELAKLVSYARDDDRWNLLYRILFRLRFENANLLKISVDADIQKAESLQKSVRHDIHKMHAFVRFKKNIVEGEDIYVAWHRPEHLTVRPGTPFFARRFGDRRWSIFTPDESAHWDLKELTFGPGIQQNEFKATDDWDEVWKTYYKSIFNPARIKIKMMKSEMAPKYWSSMPETSLIQDLIREAPLRLQNMIENQNRAAVVDPHLTLPELKIAAQSCTACPLYAQATQSVFGVGPHDAEIMIIGEQPGDQEDLAGTPFAGPAGAVLDEAFANAGIDRNRIYLTNAVKHFKWTQRGKLRMHQKPTGGEMHACKPWLEAEIAKVKPKIIIALGATAGTAIIGKLPKIGDERGKIITSLKIAPQVILSWHPAAILRASDEAESQLRRKQLADDLRLAIQSVSSFPV
ncbi:MAG: UdgX family uracil-DNA binding protein [Bdellovibrionaceae bacterium]|nr:UdgX family uracil-DNA binding protein [Bdellovibrio sp.]